MPLYIPARRKHCFQRFCHGFPSFQWNTGHFDPSVTLNGRSMNSYLQTGIYTYRCTVLSGFPCYIKTKQEQSCSTQSWYYLAEGHTSISDTYDCQRSLPSAWFDFCPLKHQALQLMVDFPVLPLRKQKGTEQCLGTHQHFLRWQTISPKEKKEEVMFLLYYTWVPLELETLSKQGKDPDSQSSFHSSLTSR